MNPKFLATTVLFLIQLCVFLPNASTQGERGHNGAISKEEMLSIFKAELRDWDKGWVDGYVINGKDVIDIVRDTKLSIRIKNSVIKGGLDFASLPAKSIGELEKPSNWNNDEWNTRIKQLQSYIKEDIYIVSNQITINDSDIETIDNRSIVANTGFVTLFYEAITFNGSTFSGTTSFTRAIFSTWAGFSGATFSGWADFFGATFTGGTSFTRATFIGGTSFREAKFIGDANFVEANISGDAWFQMASFSGIANFNKATFSGDADFKQARFSGNASFQTAKFSREADFRLARFSELGSFLLATFSGYARFDNSEFNWGAEFSNTEFSGDTGFDSAKFNDNVNFIKATFRGYASFAKAEFYGNADFFGAVFQKTAYFRESSFSKSLRLDLIKVKEYADFRDTTINLLSFYNQQSPAIIESRVDFRKSQISEADFEDIIFEKDGDFSDATFGLAVFRSITFESNASFIRTKLDDRFALERVNFKGEANFTEADFKGSSGNKSQERFSLSYVNFHNLILNWDQFPPPSCWVRSSDRRILSFVDFENAKNAQKEAAKNAEGKKSKVEPLQPLSQVFKQLETNFRKNDQTDDANKAHYYRIEAEHKETPNVDPLSSVTYWIYGVPTGHGTKFLRVAFLCIAIDIIFAIIYFFGNLIRQHGTRAELDYSFKQRFFDLPNRYLTDSAEAWTQNEGVRRFTNSLILSSVVLFKFGYRDTTISGKFLGINYKYIITVEWVLGFVLLAFLVITLSNTFPVLQRLLSAVVH
jgi:hypothetical protein